MNGAVLKYIFETNLTTKRFFSGFSSPDLPLPKIKRHPAIIVLNTDAANGPGEHWCVLIILDKKKAEFFDPYGNHPNMFNFGKAFNNLKSITYNDTRVQGTLPTCGHHCLFFGINRGKGKSMKYIINKLYSKNLLKNDHKVFDFVKNSYGEDFANFNT